jgi:hypothetical protein
MCEDGGGGGTSDEIIDLTRGEFRALKAAARAAGRSVLMLMANAALAKIAFSQAVHGSKCGRLVRRAA